ncbi:MAG: CPBP family intramembrane metalloprotease [Planctomycetes bacterium]|nr:CPBP family intramembrane metalloprotease [Planctomycetota bacterium]
MSRAVSIAAIVILPVLVISSGADAYLQQAEPNIIGEVAAMDESSVEAVAVDQGLVWPQIVIGLIAIGLFVWRRWYRLNDAPSRPVAFSPIEGLALFLVMFSIAALGALAANKIFNIVPPDEGSVLALADLAKSSSGVYVAQGLAALVFAWLVIRAGKAAANNRWPIARAVLLGMGGLIVFLPIVGLVGFISGQISQLLTGNPPNPISHTTLNLLIESPRDVAFFTMSALVLIGAPLMEEILYRGILQQIAIRLGLGRWQAIIAVSAIFTLMHISAINYSALPTLFVISLGFGWVYEKTGRLWAPIVMHSLFNLTNILLATFTAASS